MTLIPPSAAPTSPPPVRARGLLAIAAVVLIAVGASLRCRDVATLSINGDEIYSVWETRSARKAANAVDVWTAWTNRLLMMLNPAQTVPEGISKEEAWRLRWGYRTNPLCLMVNEAAFETIGDEPLAVRFGSLLFGLAALLVLPWMARPLLGDRGALLLLAFVALCPDVVEMARDARYRSACFLFGGMAAIAAARYVRDRRQRDEVICFAACTLLVLSHLTGLLVAATIFLYLALFARGRLSMRLLPIAAGIALLAWFLGPQSKVGEVIRGGIVDKAHYPWWKLAMSLTYNVGPAMLGLGFVGIALRKQIGGKAMLPVIAAASIPALALFWMNRRNDVGPRYFGAIVAAGLIVAAAGAEALFRLGNARRLATAVAALALASQLPLLASNAVDGQRYPYSQAAEQLKKWASPEDRIVSNWSGILDYYLDPKHVVELPNHLGALEAELREGDKKRAFLVLERQRSQLVWRNPGKLRDWLETRTVKLSSLGAERLDSMLNPVGAGYRFELEIHEIDLEKLRTLPPIEPPPAKD